MAVILFIFYWLALSFATDAYALTVVMYHRFDEGKYPSTNTTNEQLAEHIALYSSKNVMPLAKAIGLLKKGVELPAHSIAITVDDAFISFYQNGYPKFAEAGLPLTLFVSTELIGAGDYMDEQMLREVVKGGLVSLGNHGGDHESFLEKTDSQIIAEISASNKTLARIDGKDGDKDSRLLSYPYGEADFRIIKLISQTNIPAAFGQHSGAIGTHSNMFYLPRFALNERYGTLERVRLALNTEPLPLRVTKVDARQIVLRVVTDVTKDSVKAMSCFNGSTGEQLAMSFNQDNSQDTLTLKGQFGEGRNRINCTKQLANKKWGWFGYQFVLPAAMPSLKENAQ